jgi:hypothetical protein
VRGIVLPRLLEGIEISPGIALRQEERGTWRLAMFLLKGKTIVVFASLPKKLEVVALSSASLATTRAS